MEHLRILPRQLALGTLLVFLWPSGAFAAAGNEDCRYSDSLTPARLPDKEVSAPELRSLESHPDQPASWLNAATLTGDTSLGLAFREEAMRLLDAQQDEGAAVVAAQLLQTEIRAGLGARMVESWKELADGVRMRLLTAVPGKIRARIGGQILEADITDLRLDLVAAHLLVGDTRGAAEVEAELPPPPPESPASWLSVAREEWTARDLRLRRSLFDLWLRPSPDDPFPRLTEIASPRVRAASVDSLLLLGRLAEREGYPAIASFAYGNIWVGPKAELRSELPSGLPERVVASILRTESNLADLHREVLERAGATGRAVPPIIESAVRAAERLVEPRTRSLAPSFLSGWRMVLFVADRSGRRAFVIWEDDSWHGPQGGQLRLQESGGLWTGISVGSWIA